MAEQQGYANNNHLDKHDAGNHAGDSPGGTDALSKAAFFHPQIPDFPPPLSDEQIQKLEQSDITSLLPKIRQKYQVVLAAYLREQHREQQLQFMARIFAKLQNLCWDAPLSPLWEACIALVEGLQNGSIKQSLPVTNLLRSVDLQLRAFVVKGPSFINTTPDDRLFRGLLYFIAQSQSEGDGSFGSAIKARYKLHDALNNGEGNAIAGKEAAIQALSSELTGIKDALNLYLMATEPDPLPLQNQLPIIQQVSDTLIMLGLEEQGQQVLHYKQQLHSVIETGHSAQSSDAETALITIATGLLKLETVLHQLASGKPAESTPLPASLTLVEIEPDTTVPKRSSNAIFQTDEPLVEQTESSSDLPETTSRSTPENSSEGKTGLIDKDLLEVFREEASDVQKQLTSLIPRWQSSADRQLEILADIRRAFHTLKGSGRMVEANIIGELAWSIENMLNRLIEGTTTFTPDMVNLVARTNDMLPALLDDYIHDNQLLTPDVLVCMEMADALAIGEQYSAPEHPDAPEEDDDSSIAVQFGEIIDDQPLQTPAVSQVQHGIEVEEIELLDLFLDEAFEISEGTHQALEDWVKETSNPEPVKEIQRLLHSLKDGARISEQHDLADLSHALEGVYQLIASRQFTNEKWTADVPLGLMQASHDRIDQILQAIKADQPIPDTLIYLQKLNEWQAQQNIPSFQQRRESTTTVDPRLRGNDGGVTSLTAEPELLTTDEAHHLPDYLAQPFAGEPQSDDIEYTPVSRQLKQNRERGQVSAELFEQLINLSDDSSINHARIEQEVTDIRHTLDKVETTIIRITEQLDMETQPQLSRSLMESASALADLRLVIAKKSSEAGTLLMQQSGTQIQLQDKLLQARMVSFSCLLPKLKQITARVSDELGKPVKLNVQNAEGKMDRTMLDRILSPLEYLIRNAISNSIEDADDRRATGKPETGQLELVVKREGTEIVLELHDDGEGIDVDAIQTKAVEMHLIAPDDQLPDSDLTQLILEPGFSTTDTSAHGVGLDRVNAEIRQMGGSMQIESTHGKGCCFRLRLPFTLSMHRVLVAQAGDSLYALPLQSIAGVTTIAANTLASCFQNALPLELAGDQYQVLSLGQLTGNTAPEVQEASSHMVLLDRGGQKYALHVDELIGRRDIVSKTPGPQFATLSGVKGATILGDGRVVIVIDPAVLIRQFRVNEYYAHHRRTPDMNKRFKL